jgi:hypothetical protein
MQRIFISYSRKDINFVRRLAGDLEKAGYDVWWDLTDLRGGDDWVRVIPEAIKNSDKFIVVLSSNSSISDWVEKEYTQALSLRKKIIPIMLEQSSVPFALNTINYIDFTGDDYAVSLNNLLTALGYTGEPIVATMTVTMRLRKYAVPILIGALVLLGLLSTLIPKPTPIPTGTQTQLPTPSAVPSATQVVTLTLTESPTVSPTVSATITLSPTVADTQTLTLAPSLTPSATAIPFNRLIFCVNSLYANSINVRSGPGTIYAPIGEPLLVGKCLAFSARNEEATWLQVAPDQPDSTLNQYVGGWIFRELLGLGSIGSIDLPAVTLTPTPTPSETPTITPTFTRTSTATATPSLTQTPSETPSLTETETLSPTETATP